MKKQGIILGVLSLFALSLCTFFIFKTLNVHKNHINDASAQTNSTDSTELIPLQEPLEQSKSSSLSAQTQKIPSTQSLNLLKDLSVDLPLAAMTKLYRSKSFLFILSMNNTNNTVYAGKLDDLTFNTLDIDLPIYELYTSPNTDTIYIKTIKDNENRLIALNYPDLTFQYESNFDPSFMTTFSPIDETLLLTSRVNETGTSYIALDQPSLDSHMDLVDVFDKDKLYGTSIDKILLSADKRYLAYSIDNQGNYDFYVHDLWQNTRTLIDSSDQPLTFSFNDACIDYYNNTSLKLVHMDLKSKSKQSESFEQISEAVTYEDQLIVLYQTNENEIRLGKYDTIPLTLEENHTAESALADSPNVYDIVIDNGIVIDPETGTIKLNHQVGITGKSIAVITPDKLQGHKVIDATNQVVSPGFIDLLSYNPSALGVKYKVYDGVTTNLSMHGCTTDFPSFFKQYENNPIKVNYGGALFAMKLRQQIGLGRYDKASDEQISIMKDLAREAIKGGALGIAFSPEYYPGTTDKEIRGLMEVGKEFGLTTFFHGRYSSLTGEKTNIDTTKEIIGYARELDVPVHIMHINSTGGTGCMDDALNLVEEARTQEELDITFCTYPYNYWATYIGSARFNEGWQERFNITYSDLQLAGTTELLTEARFNELRKTWKLVIAYALPEEDIIKSLQSDFGMLGSDTIIRSEKANDHPRGSGTYARTLGYYARQRDVIPLMQGLKYMTSNVVHRLESVSPSIALKGRLQEGMDADITLFDPFNIIDTATPEMPASYSKGVSYVLVNGQLVKTPEGLTNANPGGPISGEFKNLKSVSK